MHDHPYGYLLKALTEGAGEIQQQLAVVPEGASGWRPSEDERTITEIAAHLRDAEEAYGDQIQRILRSPNAELPAVDLDLLAAERSTPAEDLDRVTRAFVRLRRLTTYLLWDIYPEDWERTGIHRYRGPVSIAQIARELHEHDLEHLWQVKRILQQWQERGSTDDMETVR